MARTADDFPPLDLLPLADGEPRERADAQRNREKVLSAAEKLFACYGVDNVSMDAIAAEAGVGKGTLFRRFGDRAGLALAMIEEHTAAIQEGMIRGPAPLGPGAPPKERLAAMARAQLGLLDKHHELMALVEMGRSGARFTKAPYVFLRVHATLLIREADPEADAELIAEMLLSPLSTDTFVHWRKVHGFEIERIAAAFDTLVERLLP
jgi:AcrR family transcriptional regulator